MVFVSRTSISRFCNAQAKRVLYENHETELLQDLNLIFFINLTR